MSSRKVRRIAIIALSLSLGISALQPAEAVQERGRRDPFIQGGFFLSTLLQNIMATLRSVSVPKWNPPGNPGNPAPGSTPQEGSGMCPNGNPRPGPGQ
jgi:hypothetical protein